MSQHQQHLILAIVRYLQETVQSGTGLKEEDLESLEVASQCLETAFGLDQLSKDDLESKYSLPGNLLEIFQAGLQQMQSRAHPQASVADKEAADKLKAEGNEFMKADNVSEAVGCYSRAIELDPNNAVYYCNRAAAFNKLGQFESAITDCSVALDIDPQYGKAYNRKGVAHISLHQFQAARDAFARALELDPQNESYKTSLEQSEQRLQEAQQREAAGGNLGGALGGLNLGGINLASMLNNPALMNMASTLMTNPAVQQMMANVMTGAQGGQQGPEGLGSLLQAGQQLAQEVQARNPELVDQLRNQMRTGDQAGQEGEGQPPGQEPSKDESGRSS